ncbi:reverse transcriptase domain-containing protein [Maridesulfovibrio sp.]|uniref:reverse transcriptase domain-containing protein n=1 Tax=Maridesulfovibrio sp. TaxID=2795000 RepID=UPI0039EEEE80
MNSIESRTNQFIAARSKAELAAALDEPYKRFCYFVYAKDPNSQYVSFNISKIRGKTRPIDAPNTPLKNIQKKLNLILSHIYKPNHCAHAYLRKKSIVTNAQPHLRSNTLIKIDLNDFFGSINFGRVMHLFMAKPFYFPQDVAVAIARIACKDNKLPQGGPASPVISNMICLKLDAQINRMAKMNRCVYTRYADDITISTRAKSLPLCIAAAVSPPKLGPTITEIIESNGFSINVNKLRLRSGFDSKVVTGVKINSKLNTIRSKVREVRAMIHAYKKFGNENALNEHITKWSRRKTSSRPKDFKTIINGKIAFIAMVKGRNDPVVLNLRTQLENCDLLENENVTPSSKLHDKYCASRATTHGVVFTEGRTDRIHLAAALMRLQKQGLFKDLKLIFYSWPWLEGGDTAVIKMCKSAKYRKFSNIPSIAIFDRDINKSENFDNKLHGNNLWSVILPIPEHRTGWDKSISIEHYYCDKTLFHEDEEGRRLYIASEFDKTTLKHKKLPDIRIPKNHNKKDHTVLNKVLDASNANICLTKVNFAKMVAQEICTLDPIDTESFIPLFKHIENLILRHTTPFSTS